MSWPAVCARGPLCPQPVMRPYTRRGFARKQTPRPRPNRSITPGRNPSISTSARASMQRTAARPSALRRFSATERLLRRFTSAGSAFPARRSTATTSAPRSASSWPTNGPGPIPLNSTTRRDVNGPLILTPLAFVQTKTAKLSRRQTQLEQIRGEAEAVDQPEYDRHHNSQPRGVPQMPGEHQVIRRKQPGAQKYQAWQPPEAQEAARGHQ